MDNTARLCAVNLLLHGIGSERSHRIDEEEFYRMLDGIVVDDTELFNDKLQEWEHFYNFNRPHGGLDGQTPYERLRQKTTESPPV